MLNHPRTFTFDNDKSDCVSNIPAVCDPPTAYPHWVRVSLVADEPIDEFDQESFSDAVDAVMKITDVLAKQVSLDIVPLDATHTRINVTIRASDPAIADAIADELMPPRMLGTAESTSEHFAIAITHAPLVETSTRSSIILQIRLT